MFFVRIEGNAMGSKIIHELFLFSDDGYEYDFFFFLKTLLLAITQGPIYLCWLWILLLKGGGLGYVFVRHFLLLSFSRLEWWRTWASLAVAWFWPRSVHKYCDEKLIFTAESPDALYVEFVLSAIVFLMNKPHGYPGLDCISFQTPNLP